VSRPTDTILATRGEAEWHVAFLMVLGLPGDQAEGTYEAMARSPLGLIPDGVHDLMIRVCRSCVRKSPASFPDPVVPLPGAIVHPIEPIR
jgi:hypothetical protein